MSTTDIKQCPDLESLLAAIRIGRLYVEKAASTEPTTRARIMRKRLAQDDLEFIDRQLKTFA